MHYNEIPVRGNGFIITGKHSLSTQIPVKKTPKIKRKSIAVPLGVFYDAASKVRRGFMAYTSEASKLNKRFINLSLSFGVALCCCGVFFNYFTFATAIYDSTQCVAVSSSATEYEKALKKAALQLGNENAAFLSEFKTSPVICLKNKVSAQSELSNKLILSSPDFKEAYVVSADGNPLFTASSLSVANEVIAEYVSSLSMNGIASTEENIKCEKKIVPLKNVLSKQECALALSESAAVDVLSVVSTAYEESVPFEIQATNDSSLYLGEKVTVSEGLPGVKEVHLETVYRNGSEQSSKIASENIIAAPVAKVVRVGTKEKDILKTGVLRPVASGKVSSEFGPRWGRVHQGIDIAVPSGTDIIAAECGTVSYVSENAGGYGKYIEIDHGMGVKTSYAHLSKILVYEGQVVGTGYKIALSGNTGNSTGPHLHFEIINNGEKINPRPYINGLEQN